MSKNKRSTPWEWAWYMAVGPLSVAFLLVVVIPIMNTLGLWDAEPSADSTAKFLVIYLGLMGGIPVSIVFSQDKKVGLILSLFYIIGPGALMNFLWPFPTSLTPSGWAFVSLPFWQVLFIIAATPLPRIFDFPQHGPPSDDSES